MGTDCAAILQGLCGLCVYLGFWRWARWLLQLCILIMQLECNLSTFKAGNELMSLYKERLKLLVQSMLRHLDVLEVLWVTNKSWG